MVLAIIFPFHDLPTRKQYRFYNFDWRIFMITTSLPFHFRILDLGGSMTEKEFKTKNLRIARI